MMTRILSVANLLGALLLMGLIALIATPAFADTEAPPPAHVIYVTEHAVYLDVGTAMGFKVGDRFEVVRNDQAIARLEAAHLSSRKTACTLSEYTDRPAMGDLASPLGSDLSWDTPLEALTDEADGIPSDLTVQTMSLKNTEFKGRIGARYWAVDDRTGRGLDYQQPSLTLRLEAGDIAGRSWDFYTDIRAKRTYRTLPDGSSPSSSRNRVYRLETIWDPEGSPWRISAGRQVSPDFAAVSLFDGIHVERRKEALSFGGFMGTQPDPADQGYSTDTFELGGFAKLETTHGGVRRSMTGGLIGSYTKGELNREYLFLRGRFNNPKLNGYISQEIDFNRGWKADAGETGLTFTSTYAYLRYQLYKTFSLTGGFDNRRRVRLYRDRVTPETDFNDEFRQGAWIGVTKKLGRATRLSANARSRSGGIRSMTFYGWTEFPSFNRLRLRVRSSGYENNYSEGWFHSVSVGGTIAKVLRWEGTHGIRREKRSGTGGDARNLHWTALDLDLTPARHWYLSLSGEVTKGDGDHHRTITTSTSFRF
ncbi:MAG: hypothetical protein KJ970_06950 [Candidatus Eisenbacteria bacterium]|uniref:Alginate export domain-containing protein n=1 Tax=Eiseniibacteriota bacterium TaxID=2212470 RepID=A0A948RTD1_UNCEI|nr:hypothetical protein [Candidatus Eisenbacteria bacterium]MBU1947993.1 hypothetical protein [Candidatus Eisenbacteria bacterium]MBU2690650.1 hypothetical protein [Candidatus Eisenbacteria bacterium]